MPGANSFPASYCVGLLPRAGHHHDGDGRPRHRREERNIDRREEQATVEVSRHQAERDRGKAGPAPGSKAPERQQRGHAGKPDQESQGMANRDPVGKVKRLDIGRKHLEPRPVIPKGKFHGLELRAVSKSARIPGERLGAVVVGVELVNGEAVVGGGGKADDKHGAEQGRGSDDLGINGTTGFRPRLQTPGECCQCSSLDGRATNAKAIDWCQFRFAPAPIRVMPGRRGAE
jgi:hypothetical protein